MICIERAITMKNDTANISDPVVLYKGDKNVQIQFELINSPFKYRAGMDAIYGQLIIKRPSAEPIFSEVTQLSKGKVLFNISGDMIDEELELGEYSFQVRLFNEDRTSRVTLPIIEAGIIIKEPICEEEYGGDTDAL